MIIGPLPKIKMLNRCIFWHKWLRVLKNRSYTSFLGVLIPRILTFFVQMFIVTLYIGLGIVIAYCFFTMWLFWHWTIRLAKKEDQAAEIITDKPIFFLPSTLFFPSEMSRTWNAPLIHLRNKTIP